MRVLKVSWEITRRCNADCAHCYVDGSHDLGELDRADTSKLLKSLFDGGVRFLTFVGGEPCVAAQFDYALEAALDLGLQCKVITNGTVPRDGLIEANRRGELDVVVSILAGTPEQFSTAYRLHPRLFEKQRQLLSRLRAFSINISLFSSNSTRAVAEAVADYLSPFREKIRDVSVFTATHNGRGIGDNLTMSHDSRQRIARQFLGQLADVGIIADFNVDCADSGPCPLIGSPLPGELFVNPSGHVRPCHALVGYETSSTLVDTPLAQLLTSDELIRWSGDRRYVYDKRCKATLMQSQVDATYVERGGGSEAFRRADIWLSDNVVVEEVSGTWYVYTTGSPSSNLELNPDAVKLIDVIRQHEWKSLARDLDDEELAAALHSVISLEAAGIVGISRPSIGAGPLPAEALSDITQVGVAPGSPNSEIEEV